MVKRLAIPPLDKLAWYCQRMTQQELAEHFQCDRRTIRSWLYKHDLKAKPGNRKRDNTVRARYLKQNSEESAREMIELAKRWR